MHKVNFEAIPVDKQFLTSKLTTTPSLSDKYDRLNSRDQKKLKFAFARGIVLQCASTSKVFKIEPFRKLIADAMKITVPPGMLIPLLMDVNTYLMEVFGYAIAPINYGTKTSLFENSSSIKELVLINVIDNSLVNEANMSSWTPAEQGKLFWTICYLYLCNGSDIDKLRDHLRVITGDSLTLVNQYLDQWEKQRYINLVKIKTGDGEMQRYEVGLRAFHEIGYKNITKFVAKVEGFEYTDEIVNTWLDDTFGGKEKKVVKQVTPTKRRARG